MQKWETNIVITEVLPRQIPIWIQLWNLPLEYQHPHLATKIAEACGEVVEVDWHNLVPRESTFMRIKVLIVPEEPFNKCSPFLD